MQRFGGELRNKGRVELVECKMGVRARSLQRQLSTNTMARLEINRYCALHYTALHYTALHYTAPHRLSTTTVAQPDADQIDSLVSSCSLHVSLYKCLLSNAAKIEYSLGRTGQDCTRLDQGQQESLWTQDHTAWRALGALTL